MAIFLININKLSTPYNRINTFIVSDNCTSQTITTNIGLENDGAVDSFEYLLKNYTGVAWKTLHITSVVYSDENTFYLEYAAASVTTLDILAIPITGLNANEIISTFNIKSIIERGELGNKSISFLLSIEDINSLIIPVITINIETIITQCATPIDTTVSEISTVPNGDCSNTGSTKTFFTVSQLDDKNITFTYTTTDNGNHGFIGNLYRLQSSAGVDDYLVSNLSNTEDNTFIIINNMSGDNEAYYSIEICAKPRLGSLLNSCALTFNIRNYLNTTNVQTFNLTDSDQ